MQSPAEFSQLLAAFLAGDRQAAEVICRQYEPLLRVVVRRHLDARLRSRFDSLDFVQDVWASVFVALRSRYEVQSPEALLGLLVRVARNKLSEEFRRRFETQKHDAGREISANELCGGLDAVAQASDTPSQQAIAAELWERLLRRVHPSQRPIVEWLREGYDYQEISRMTGISTRSVKRIVRRLKEVAGI